jgi:hypothetical protein
MEFKKIMIAYREMTTQFLEMVESTGIVRCVRCERPFTYFRNATLEIVDEAASYLLGGYAIKDILSFLPQDKCGDCKGAVGYLWDEEDCKGLFFFDTMSPSSWWEE